MLVGIQADGDNISSMINISDDNRSPITRLLTTRVQYINYHSRVFCQILVQPLK